MVHFILRCCVNQFSEHAGNEEYAFRGVMFSEYTILKVLIGVGVYLQKLWSKVCAYLKYSQACFLFTL